MKSVARSSLWAAFALAGLLGVAGCHQNQPATTDTSAQNQPDQGPDPASANLAPASYNTTEAPSGSSYTTQAPPTDNSADQGDDSDYTEQPTETAAEAPPPLPDYSQPPSPGDGYIWTPGYWGSGASGYYWVPGAWVEPPYSGALWTPGYWGYAGNRYQFYPGHWGTHIGFYGGINYGFGYGGVGYEGGYWNSGRFMYNREYNNVNVNEVHNVYSYRPQNHVIENTRVSYHGGTGGVQRRPQPQEQAAWHEPVAPRMASQVQHAQSFQTNRGQLATANHGHPVMTASTQPIRADRNVRPMTPAPHTAPVHAENRAKPAPSHGNARPEEHR
jgi:hypothetical protein